jgi:hypothetical protein
MARHVMHPARRLPSHKAIIRPRAGIGRACTWETARNPVYNFRAIQVIRPATSHDRHQSQRNFALAIFGREVLHVGAPVAGRPGTELELPAGHARHCVCECTGR